MTSAAVDPIVAARLGAYRVKQRRRPPVPQVKPFDDWLDEVSPDWPWDAAHLVKIREYLAAITAGEIDRLMIFMPPRHLKSESTTVRYSAWRLERDPTLPVIVTAYNQEHANRFSRKIRRIVRERVPLSDERVAQNEWETAAGGGVRAAGVGSPPTGVGARLIMIDDPVRSRLIADSPTYRDRMWEWYTDDVYTRADPGAAIVLVQTRWHSDDLAGRILNSGDAESWHVLNLPALAMDDDPLGREPGEALFPANYPVETLERIRRVHDEGERGWWALYQGMPQPQAGTLYQQAWWDGQNRYDWHDPALRSQTVARVMSWDTAQGTGADNAYTAVVVADLIPYADGYAALIRDVWRARVGFVNLLQAIVNKAVEWNTDGRLEVMGARSVVIEDASSGSFAVQMLRAEAPEWLRPLIFAQPARIPKDARGRLAAVPCERGRVWLPQPDPDLPWLLPFERELYAAPNTTYRDQTDAFAQLVLGLKRELRTYTQSVEPDREAA